ncbi:MAG: FkbM family methyltransferase [Acidimicrobiaceae bacterium]|nr:FkbM family methyltransferase [Acidimicrobiaceae bacterium]
MYFADKGAVHVHAFEPFLEPYSTAVRVINRNLLDHKVTVIPTGVGARCGGSIGVYNPAHSTWGVASLDKSTTQPPAGRASNPTEEVQLVSLPSVLDEASKHHPGRPLALKMDCEGCEIEAFEGDGIRESLKPVRSIVHEAHGDEAMNKEIRHAYRQAGRSHSRQTLWSKLEDYGFSVEELSASPGRSGRVLLLATRREGAASRPSAVGPVDPAP